MNCVSTAGSKEVLAHGERPTELSLILLSTADDISDRVLFLFAAALQRVLTIDTAAFTTRSCLLLLQLGEKAENLSFGGLKVSGAPLKNGLPFLLEVDARWQVNTDAV